MHEIKIILFDLDDTLVKTDDLEIFRNLEHPLYKKNDNFSEYIKSIEVALQNKKDRYIFNQWMLKQIKERGIRIGIVTKSPRPYCYAITSCLYRDVKFDVIVAHEDVEKQKPSGKGIINALIRLRRDDLNGKLDGLDGNQVLYIGDHNTDIQAAYNVGAMAALKLNEFEDYSEKNLEYLPEFTISTRCYYDLRRIIDNPDFFLPFIESNCQFRGKGEPRFLWYEKYDDHNIKYSFLVAGRYFPENSKYQLKRQYHSFSKEILCQKNSVKFSNKWLEALRLIILKESVLSLISHQNLIVTCIPRRHDSIPRMESLLEQLANYLKINHIRRDCTIHIVTDLFAYSENAVSNHKTARTRVERYTNVRNNLFIKRKNLLVNDIDKVIVIDDVVTTGASLIVATEKLMQAGVKTIIRFAFAQAISF